MPIDDIIAQQTGVDSRSRRHSDISENPVSSPLKQARRWYERLMQNVKADREDINFVASLIVTLATVFGGGG